MASLVCYAYKTLLLTQYLAEKALGGKSKICIILTEKSGLKK